MKASVIAVGSEMLTPFRVDTNSLAITARLDELGIAVRQKSVVGDDLEDLSRAFLEALAWADVLVVTGGLGPTEDDLTREAISHALGLPLEHNQSVEDGLRARFARAGLQMRENNLRQAMVVRGAAILENTRGSAPGLLIEDASRLIVLLPGPPREMQPMFDHVITEHLAPRSGGVSAFRRLLKIAGRAESDVDACAAPVYTRWLTEDPPIATTILATPAQIELHLLLRSANRAAAAQRLDAAVAELVAALGHSVFSTDGRALEEVVGALLRSQKLQIAVAESCTGGLLASRLTDVPGSSTYVERGVVCYSNRSKTELLDVPAELIETHGAVSDPVARAMAEGVRRRAGTHVGIGITGIAGPDGGTPEKPVGTVSIAVLCRNAERVSTFRFLGNREQVKIRSVQAALNVLRLLLHAS